MYVVLGFLIRGFGVTLAGWAAVYYFSLRFSGGDPAEDVSYFYVTMKAHSPAFAIWSAALFAIGALMAWGGLVMMRRAIRRGQDASASPA